MSSDHEDLAKAATAGISAMLSLMGKRMLSAVCQGSVIGLRLNLILIGRPEDNLKHAGAVIVVAGEMADDDLRRLKAYIEAFGQDVHAGLKMEQAMKIDQLGLTEEQKESGGASS